MSMTKETLAAVRDLAEEVAELAGIVEGERAREAARWKRDHGLDNMTFWGGTKNTGALRRRSMDLTRALADLRRA